MKILKFLTLFCIGLLTFNLSAQDLEYMVISSSGINLRMQPNRTSEVVVPIPFGQMVKWVNPKGINNYRFVVDTIENLPGSWVYVEYEKKRGYVFSVYISEHIQNHHIQFKKGLPQFVYEGELNCGDQIFLNRDLYWYGVYDRPQGKLQLQAVNPKITPYYEEVEHYVNYRISTEYSMKSKFLFGLPTAIKDTSIHQGLLSNTSSFLFPGTSIPLGHSSKTRIIYSIDVLGVVDSISFSIRNSYDALANIRDYQVRLTGFNHDIVQTQNLTKEVDGGLNHDVFKIVFAGDLNSDEIPDFIIKTYRSEVSEFYLHLLMSGQTTEKMVEKVAENYWGGCY